MSAYVLQPTDTGFLGLVLIIGSKDPDIDLLADIHKFLHTNESNSCHKISNDGRIFYTLLSEMTRHTINPTNDGRNNMRKLTLD